MTRGRDGFHWRCGRVLGATAGQVAKRRALRSTRNHASENATQTHHTFLTRAPLRVISRKSHARAGMRDQNLLAAQCVLGDRFLWRAEGRGPPENRRDARLTWVA